MSSTIIIALTMQMSNLINLEANQEFQSNVYLDEISSLFLDTLGQLALFLFMHALNGYMSTITNMNQPISRWRCREVPFTKCQPQLAHLVNHLSYP